MKEFDVRDLACPGPVLKLRGLLDEGEREIEFHVAGRKGIQAFRFAGVPMAATYADFPERPTADDAERLARVEILECIGNMCCYHGIIPEIGGCRAAAASPCKMQKDGRCRQPSIRYGTLGIHADHGNLLGDH